jgi:hypothetical protein
MRDGTAAASGTGRGADLRALRIVIGDELVPVYLFVATLGY